MAKELFITDKNGSNFNKSLERIAKAIYSRLGGKKNIKVTVEDETFNRTAQQNKYLWGVVYKAIVDEENGALFDEKMDQYLADKPLSKAEVVHELMKEKFLRPLVIELPMSVKLVTPSTTKLNTKQFTEYVESVRDHASAMWGIYIPSPEDLQMQNVNKWYAL